MVILLQVFWGQYSLILPPRNDTEGHSSFTPTHNVATEITGEEMCGIGTTRA